MSKFTLPKSWDEISLQQFIEIKETVDLQSTDFYKAVEMVSILTETDINDSDIEDMDINEFTKIINELKWFSSQPPLDFKKEISGLQCIEMNTLTLGEFIDLEHYFSESYIKNLPQICAILYRQSKLDDWDNIVIEPYDNINIEERAKLFIDIPISHNYGIIDYYIKFKTMFYNNYRTLFNVQDDEDDEDDEDKNDIELQKEIKREKLVAKWSWENTLDKLTGGDLTKYDDILNLKLIFVFNQMSFTKEMKS
jgi:hypothetical protein